MMTTDRDSGHTSGFWGTIHRIAASDRVSGLVMLGFALVGLVLANLPATAHLFETIAETHIAVPYTNLDLPVGHWAQDGLLTIFFLTVGLELKQELTTGSLANPKAAAVPMLCAVGGMLTPPVLFIAVTALFSQYGPGSVGDLLLITTGSNIPFGEMIRGWAVPTATDIAFSLAVLALFAKALPGSIRAFLMTLATVDDLLAIILIAVFFSSLNAWYWFIGIALCAAAWAFLVRLKRVPWPLVAVVGLLAWTCMFEAGVHPTLAGVLVGLLTPSREMHGEASPRASRYAEKLQPFSALLALPIFALFATGVHFESLTPELMLSPLVLALIVALVVGKPLGIMATAWIATHVAGLSMAKGLRVRDMLPAACACGIGFTVSFLIASLAYDNPELSAEARFGVLAGSLIAAAISGVLLNRQSRRYERANARRRIDEEIEQLETEHVTILPDGTVRVDIDAFTPEQLAELKARREERRRRLEGAAKTASDDGSKPVHRRLIRRLRWRRRHR
ncbi:sodium:proton antiporter [Bifidobacterium sp. UTCIF-37]|nr:sodium:proton antiporter [Bifidobacterium sp. UTCIF-37]TPF89878.1 sodium:proton antiporter [Bifidobacterium sp. UTCIF-38]